MRLSGFMGCLDIMQSGCCDAVRVCWCNEMRAFAWEHRDGGVVYCKDDLPDSWAERGSDTRVRVARGLPVRALLDAHVSGVARACSVMGHASGVRLAGADGGSSCCFGPSALPSGATGVCGDDRGSHGGCCSGDECGSMSSGGGSYSIASSDSFSFGWANKCLHRAVLRLLGPGEARSSAAAYFKTHCGNDARGGCAGDAIERSNFEVVLRFLLDRDLFVWVYEPGLLDEVWCLGFASGSCLGSLCWDCERGHVRPGVALIGCPVDSPRAAPWARSGVGAPKKNKVRGEQLLNATPARVTQVGV